MGPKNSGELALLVAVFVEALFEQLLSDEAGLGKTQLDRKSVVPRV